MASSSRKSPSARAKKGSPRSGKKRATKAPAPVDFDGLGTKIDGVEKRLDKKIDGVDKKIDDVEKRLSHLIGSEISRALGVMEERFSELFGLLNEKFGARIQRLQEDLDDHRFDRTVHLPGSGTTRTSEARTRYKTASRKKRRRRR